MTVSRKPIRIVLHIQPEHTDYDTIRRTASEAEDLGVDMVFNYDHFLPQHGDPNGNIFECWTMLGAWAESTSRVEIGAAVTCNAFRNPDLLAHMARTVDHISGGRLILGIGSGWKEREFDEYGYEFGTAGTRLDDLAAALPRIERRFATLNPRPTRKIPVMIGGNGEQKTLPMVARHADIWHCLGGIDILRQKSAVLDQRCAAIGRDPSEIERCASVSPALGNTPPELVDLGFTMLSWSMSGPDFDLEPLRKWIAWRDQLDA
jgi:probable F420-dependent oxidoreductase